MNTVAGTHWSLDLWHQLCTLTWHIKHWADTVTVFNRQLCHVCSKRVDRHLGESIDFVSESSRSGGWVYIIVEVYVRMRASTGIKNILWRCHSPTPLLLAMDALELVCNMSPGLHVEIAWSTWVMFSHERISVISCHFRLKNHLLKVHVFHKSLLSIIDCHSQNVFRCFLSFYFCFTFWLICCLSQHIATSVKLLFAGENQY